MHWSILRIIWFREMRDLLRDRRTLFMIFVLPVVLYPLMGGIGLTFAKTKAARPSIVGIWGVQHLPQLSALSMGHSPVPVVACLSATSGGLDQAAGAAALWHADLTAQDYPPLIVEDRFPAKYCETRMEARVISIVPLDSADRGPLDAKPKQVDVLLIVPADFGARLSRGEQVVLELVSREGDENSRLAERRLRFILERWQQNLKTLRLLKQGLPSTFDAPIDVQGKREKEPLKEAADEVATILARNFPFLFIMWALAGALHPAIDLTAGEKERGTLETLLLSPATRAEIVGGKFLAIWAFSTATAMWNLAWLGGGAWLASFWLPFPLIHGRGLVWGGVLTFLISGLFSAVSLALGAFARSTKEGQYYLLPLFLITMPLTFLPLVPGVELNLFYSVVPITGATLLLQQMMQPVPEPWSWLYVVPVLASLVVASALALYWAVAQFQREEVLFRDAAGLRIGAWVGRLLRGR